MISYRREDAPADARGICDRLRSQFGGANIFMDIDQLLAGQRVDRELEKPLASCEVPIAIIGLQWMELAQEQAAVHSCTILIPCSTFSPTSL